MHRTTLAGPQGRSRSRGCRPRTLEDRLARNGPPRGRPTLRSRLGTRRLLRRSLIDRAGPGLRHDHAPHRPRNSRGNRRLRRLCLHWCWSFCRWRRSSLRRGCGSWRPYRRRSTHFGLRCRFMSGLLSWRRRSSMRRTRRRRRHSWGRNRWNSCLGHRSGRFGCKRCLRRRHGGGRTWRGHCSRARWRLRSTGWTRRGNWLRFLLDRLEHVARPGNVRKVELRPDLLGSEAATTRLLDSSRRPVSGKVLAHLLRFVHFN